MDNRIATFLLLQITKAWHPDVIALARSYPTKLSKTPKLQTPPIITMLARLADAPATGDQPEGKELPCGHRVDVRIILTRVNLFGDQKWGRGPHLLHCPHRHCDKQYALPMIPGPSGVSGLEARLDLIQWIWARDKHAPDKMDVKVVKIMRYILDQIGYVPRNPQTISSFSWSRPSERRLRQTLDVFEKEGVVGAEGKLSPGPRQVRGLEPFCQYRCPRTLTPERVEFQYRLPSRGRYCVCEERHERVRKPSDWASTPAEDEEEWRFEIHRVEREARKVGGEKEKKKNKRVRFVAPVITSVRYYERWWTDEYRDSDRYYSSGPCTTSSDPSTRLDDDREIARLDGSCTCGGAGQTLEDGNDGTKGRNPGGGSHPPYYGDPAIRYERE